MAFLYESMQIAYPGDTLLAPGILRNPVEVESLYDPQAARRATLRNLLQREGYESLDSVRAESEAKGLKAGQVLALKETIYHILATKDETVSDTQRGIIDDCQAVDQLKMWLNQAITASSIETLFFDEDSDM